MPEEYYLWSLHKQGILEIALFIDSIHQIHESPISHHLSQYIHSACAYFASLFSSPQSFTIPLRISFFFGGSIFPVLRVLGLDFCSILQKRIAFFSHSFFQEILKANQEIGDWLEMMEKKRRWMAPWMRP